LASRLSDQLPESCVRICPYNVHGFAAGTDGRKAPAHRRGDPRASSYDPVGLQEVRLTGSTTSGRVDSAVRALGSRWCAMTAVNGNALLTRRKCSTCGAWGRLWRREPRNALDVDLDVNCGQKLRVIVTHLGLFPRSGAGR